MSIQDHFLLFFLLPVSSGMGSSTLGSVLYIRITVVGSVHVKWYLSHSSCEIYGIL